MKKNNTLLSGVVYKGAEPFLSKYFDSIKRQTDKNFDVIIVNDGLNEEEIKKYQEDIDITLMLEKQTIAQVRQKIINYAYENRYDNLIFSDTDDYFSEHRVELSKIYLEDYDFVFTELDLVDEQDKLIASDFLSGIISNDELLDFKVLLDKNIVGMGNSAINLTKVDKIIIPSDIIAVDWYLFSCLLLRGAVGKFIANSHTFYRQHPGNLIGMIGALNSDKLVFGIDVKKVHYDKMHVFCDKNNFKTALTLYGEKNEEIKKLEDQITDLTFKNNYISTINRFYSKIFTGWWSDILTLKEFRTYES